MLLKVPLSHICRSRRFILFLDIGGGCEFYFIAD